MDGDGLIWWSTARATVGLVVRDNRIVETAPYARRWAYGKDAHRLWDRGSRQPSVTLAWIPADEGLDGHPSRDTDP